MPHFTVVSPGLATFYDVEGIPSKVNYAVSTIGRHHLLQTTEYYEGGPELDEIRAFQPSAWGVEVPENAELFATTGGLTPENVRQFWVGWLLGRRVSMLALMQERPIDIALATDETPVFPAVMDKAGVAALYAWRPVADSGGTALWRHLCTGALKTQASVVTEALTAIPGRPVVSVVGAIPGEPTQHALIGWAENTPAGAVIGLAVVRPEGIRIVRSAPLSGLSPLARQRPGIWASAPPAAEGYELLLVLQSTAEPHDYKTAKLVAGATPEEHKVSLDAVRLPGDSLHAAAFDYLKNHIDAMANQAFLTKDGRLWFGPPATLMKQGLSLDDPLTILTTGRAYFGERAVDGTLSFQLLSPL